MVVCLADELLKITDVATELKVHPDTVRRWIKEGKLTPTRLGGTRIRIRRSELDKFLAEGDQPDDKGD
jgi:excisionase family DNA binding protein